MENRSPIKPELRRPYLQSNDSNGANEKQGQNIAGKIPKNGGIEGDLQGLSSLPLLGEGRTIEGRGHGGPGPRNGYQNRGYAPAENTPLVYTYEKGDSHQGVEKEGDG
jgi:hypothetical protein